MLYSIKQVSRLYNISRRTLRYYDQIGLLKPTKLTAAGYRLYDSPTLIRLQEILFLKELDLSLKEIASIVQHPEYDRIDLLKKHRSLLILKRDRLNQIIRLTDQQLKGEKSMQYKKLQTSQMEKLKQQYADEVKKRWGNTDAYAQYQQNSKDKTAKEQNDATAEAEIILHSLAQRIGESPQSHDVQALVGSWQQHITRHYYRCTNEILACLGEMYTSDPRFSDFFSSFHPKFAEFFHQAIAHYCKKQS